MTLSKVQIGAIGQYEAAKLMMMGSDGKLEVAAPLSDDDRRDQEIHARGQFGKALALQIKTSMHLRRRWSRMTPVLCVSFKANAATVISHPFFWYLFAYLDPKTMAFADPLFLVNSAAVHAGLHDRRGKTWLEFTASMGAQTHDQWVPNRVHPADLGKRVLHILNTRSRLSMAKLPPMTARGSDLIWVDAHRAAA